MNLKTQIRPELWQSIASTYAAENYSHAILDAMHHLSNVLRDKSGLDGDGTTLVGQALGGSSPKIMITRMQTETEKNVQNGIQQILRGLYQAVRNPRSHEQEEDDKKTADAVIAFVDYLLGILGAAEENFTVQKFVDRVHDPDFVDSDRYAELLVAEVPERRLLDALIELYRTKIYNSFSAAHRVVKAVLPRLSDEQKKEFVEVVSEELKTTRVESDVIGAFALLSPDLWGEVEEVAQLRAEQKVIKSIKNGALHKHCGSQITPTKPSHEGTCPYCKETIHPEALKCKHCHSILTETLMPPIQSPFDLVFKEKGKPSRWICVYLPDGRQFCVYEGTGDVVILDLIR